MSRIVSRNVGTTQLKNRYRQIMGQDPPAINKAEETYSSYRNKLVNQMLGQPDTKLKYGERISKNKTTDRPQGVGRPRTTGRARVCEIVGKGKNTDKLAEQNYECKAQRRSPEMKEEKESKQEEQNISIQQLETKGIDVMRRIVTALIPSRQRTATILRERYDARRGVLNDLSVADMVDLLRQNNITEITGSDAMRILLR